MSKQKWHLQTKQRGWLKDTACGIKMKDVIAVKSADKKLVDCKECKALSQKGGV